MHCLPARTRKGPTKLESKEIFDLLATVMCSACALCSALRWCGESAAVFPYQRVGGTQLNSPSSEQLRLPCSLTQQSMADKSSHHATGSGNRGDGTAAPGGMELSALFSHSKRTRGTVLMCRFSLHTQPSSSSHHLGTSSTVHFWNTSSVAVQSLAIPTSLHSLAVTSQSLSHLHSGRSAPSVMVSTRWLLLLAVAGVLLAYALSGQLREGLCGVEAYELEQF
jgi:hypothetical protein